MRFELGFLDLPGSLQGRGKCGISLRATRVERWSAARQLADVGEPVLRIRTIADVEGPADERGTEVAAAGPDDLYVLHLLVPQPLDRRDVRRLRQLGLEHQLGVIVRLEAHHDARLRVDRDDLPVDRRLADHAFKFAERLFRLALDRPAGEQAVECGAIEALGLRLLDDLAGRFLDRVDGLGQILRRLLDEDQRPTPVDGRESALGDAAFRTDILKIAGRLVEDYSPEKPTDAALLEVGREWVAAWRDSEVLDRVTSKVSDGPSTAWYLLEPLAKPYAKEGEPTDTSAQRRAAIAAWRASDDAKYDPSRLKPYTTLGDRVPPGRVITDPNSDEFRNELEIGKLAVEAIDVAWVIDSTGSMHFPNQVIASQTGHFAATLGVLTDRVRFSVSYYRHELDPKLAKGCCASAAKPPFYQVRTYPMTSNIPFIVKTMADEPIPGPDTKKYRNTHQGTALAGGIQGSLRSAQWIGKTQGQRVMILVGDSAVTAGSEDAVKALVKQAIDDGYAVHNLILALAVNSWPAFFEGTGVIQHKVGKIAETGGVPSKKALEAFKAIEDSVVYSSVSKNFHNRLEPLLKAMQPYIQSTADR